MKVLACGTGPAAIQLCLLAKKFFPTSTIQMLTRASHKNLELEARNEKGQLEFFVTTTRQDLEPFCGNFKVSKIHTTLQNITDTFDFAIFAQPTFEYVSTLRELLIRNALTPQVVILTASSRLAVSAEMHALLEKYLPQSCLITMSDYLAVTVRDPRNPAGAIASDEKSYLRYSILGNPTATVRNFIDYHLKKYVTDLTEFSSAWEVEQGNTNLFHLPIIIHPSLTDHFFDPQRPNTFFYGPYPWGAYSAEVITQVVQFEDELLAVFKSLGLPAINFFKFRMSRANLPLEAVDSTTIEKYPSMERNERRALHTLFLWMTERKRMGLEGVGKVVDTSSLPKFPKVTLIGNEGHLPRIPLEDYTSLKGILAYTQQAGLNTPLFKFLCDTFEKNCVTEPKRYGYNLTFTPKQFAKMAEEQAKVLRKQATTIT